MAALVRGDHIAEKETSLVVLEEILCGDGYSFSIETLVAFTSPYAESPTFNPSSFSERVVITAATGPIVVSKTTSLSTGSDVISLIVPGIRFRML